MAAMFCMTQSGYLAASTVTAGVLLELPVVLFVDVQPHVNDLKKTNKAQIKSTHKQLQTATLLLLVRKDKSYFFMSTEMHD